MERSQEMCGMEGDRNKHERGAWGCANVIRKTVWSVGQIGSEEFSVESREVEFCEWENVSVILFENRMMLPFRWQQL